MSNTLADIPCLKAETRFPTDWVPLIDAARNLKLAITLVYEKPD